MSLTIDKIFTPITASPFNSNKDYIEIPPCEALKPYVRCFWGSPQNKSDCPLGTNTQTLVVPDICMDIIINVKTDENKIYSHFCGINNQPFISYKNDAENAGFCFAIRFYAWSVALFSDENIKYTLNAFTDAEAYFSKFASRFETELVYTKNIYERKAIAEKFLLKHLNPYRENPDVMNSIYHIITKNGNISVSSLSDFCFTGRRQLERLFLENTGVSPKQMINLIRYQLLWQETLKPRFNIQDAVSKFGYCDQSHLLRDFKKYHGKTINEAKALALK